MNIYLIRHGDAEKASMYKKDSERMLTPAGIEITGKAAENWIKIILSLDYILSSPYKRAVQTAEIIATRFGIKDVLTEKKLAPGSRIEDLLEILHIYNGKNIAVVGHQPDLSEIASGFISNSNAYIEFRKTTIAKISFGNKIRRGKGTLEFLITPELFTSK
jgi:phosphohistidine phosphatase